MKTRDSGMPEQAHWETFFDPIVVLRLLGLDQTRGLIVDVGCGYGTFTLPVGRLTGQPVLGFDIEPDLVRQLTGKARDLELTNISARQRDVTYEGLGLADGSADIVLLFNLLHCEDPAALLAEAHRVLMPAGRVGVIHWRSDIPTPRGPDWTIRPTPDTCREWLLAAGFVLRIEPMMLEPYHFGMVGEVQRERAERGVHQATWAPSNQSHPLSSTQLRVGAGPPMRR